MSLCRLLVPAVDSGCGLCVTDKRREKYLGKFFEHLPFKEAKCERKKKTSALCCGYSRATSTEDSLWEGCEFCSTLATGTGRILMKSSTSAMGRAWKEGQQCTCREVSPHSCRANPGTSSKDRLHLSHMEPQSGLLDNRK